MKKSKKDTKKEQGQAAQNKQEGFVAQIFNFFDQYNKVIYGIAFGLLVIVALLLAFNRFYIAPQSQKASKLMTAPIELMMQGDTLSLSKALEGDDENEGFLNVAASFKFTSAANTAKYFAGMCYLKLGDKEEALKYLLKFKQKEDIHWYGAQAIISDIYDDRGDMKNALKYCKKAAESKDPYHGPINLFKLGQLYEREGDWKKAAGAYESIQNKFYAEYQKMNIDKFLERARNNKN
jgi:tetratricopeptide (TPR) repeat protein